MHGRVDPLQQKSAFPPPPEEQGRFPSPDSIGPSSKLIGNRKDKSLCCLNGIRRVLEILQSDSFADDWVTGGPGTKIYPQIDADLPFKRKLNERNRTNEIGLELIKTNSTQYLYGPQGIRSRISQNGRHATQSCTVELTLYYKKIGFSAPSRGIGRFPSLDSIGPSSNLIGNRKDKSLCCLNGIRTCSRILQSDSFADDWVTGGPGTKNLPTDWMSICHSKGN
ncbi:hypothetical protein CEXT_166391 [Caerostris extrusa]|uniref:Uncharacterized protein n=1 Tax=Caerostris extrusa TaxID=172846 RepID=A0AAV4V687_CAEEX|nr:hypothetical protein CEXT_166391 [Caerostris extrusa]